MSENHKLSRRNFIKTTAAASAAAASPLAVLRRARAQSGAHEIVHWSWLAASDAEVWGKMIDSFNEAHRDTGVQIRLEVVPYDQYRTKILAAAATGTAPDFGWGTAGLDALMAKEGVTVALDNLAAQVGLDLSDFSEASLKAARFPQYDNQLHMIPMDLMSLQPLVNLDHVSEAGLDAGSFPASNDSLLEWAQAMTKRDGDKVKRSGILMTGSALQPNVTWGIVAAQMGFKRASDDLTEAAINPQAGKDAMQWVLDLFDKHSVSSRDITDRYKAFGTGQGSIFWTGPWTLNGYTSQGLKFAAFPFPAIGTNPVTYFEMGGLQLYKQRDEGRYQATLEAVKWLSDNTFPWTTVGRGASPRKSIVERPDYRTAGHDWSVRGAFVEGLAFATEGEIPVLNAPDFTIYSGDNFLARTLDGVWVGKTTIDDAMEQIAEKWQQNLDKG
ncbi:MAG: extracellular solute-binding protein [Gammaproteobacteria bacterium]